MSADSNAKAQITLERIEKREKTDLGQWKFHLSAFILIIVAFMVQLLRGTEKAPSIAGVERCSAPDNIILGSFLLFAAIMVYYEIKRV